MSVALLWLVTCGQLAGASSVLPSRLDTEILLKFEAGPVQLPLDGGTLLLWSDDRTSNSDEADLYNSWIDGRTAKPAAIAVLALSQDDRAATLGQLPQSAPLLAWENRRDDGTHVRLCQLQPILSGAFTCRDAGDLGLGTAPSFSWTDRHLLAWLPFDAGEIQVIDVSSPPHSSIIRYPLSWPATRTSLMTRGPSELVVLAGVPDGGWRAVVFVDGGVSELDAGTNATQGIGSDDGFSWCSIENNQRFRSNIPRGSRSSLMQFSKSLSDGGPLAFAMGDCWGVGPTYARDPAVLGSGREVIELVGGAPDRLSFATTVPGAPPFVTRGCSMRATWTREQRMQEILTQEISMLALSMLALPTVARSTQGKSMPGASMAGTREMAATREMAVFWTMPAARMAGCRRTPVLTGVLFRSSTVVPMPGFQTSRA